MRRYLIFLLALALLISAAPAHGEYVHGEPRYGDSNVILCPNLSDAVEIAKLVNILRIVRDTKQKEWEPLEGKDKYPLGSLHAVKLINKKITLRLCGNAITFSHVSLKTVYYKPEEGRILTYKVVKTIGLQGIFKRPM
jgi:hypothetical protein